MSALASMTIANWPSFLRGLSEAKTLQVRYMRGEMKRGAQRIRKSFINKQLKGPPGIKAGPLAKGKNVWTFAGGSSAQMIFAKIGISRILHVHEKGMTITPRHGDKLYLHEKGKDSPIIAVVPKVKIPARLKFVQQVKAEAPRELLKVAEAGKRGIEVALTKALKKAI